MILNKLQQMANKVNNKSPASPLTILLLKTWTLTVPHCSINIDDEMLKRLDLNLLNQVHNDRDWTLLLSLSLALQKAKATLQLMRLNLLRNEHALPSTLRSHSPVTTSSL